MYKIIKKEGIYIKIRYTIAATIIVLIGLHIWYTHSRTISLSINAIEYQLGESHAKYAKPVVVNVNGEIGKNWKGLYWFKGFIEVEGEVIPIPPEQRDLNLRFDRNGIAIINYASYQNGSIVMFAYGKLYLSIDLSRISISKFVSEEEDSSRKGWSSADGLIIAGPATDRNRALMISNELMKPILNGITLK